MYLDSRAARFPETEKLRATSGSGLARWSARAPLFVGRHGDRITQGTLQSRIKRAFKRAGSDAQPVPGALVHGLRHTYATEPASSSDVSVYTLMKLLRHKFMTTPQRYVAAAGSETRAAAARNPLRIHIAAKRMRSQGVIGESPIPSPPRTRVGFV
jgi:integrase/recombinase XerC